MLPLDPTSPTSRPPIPRLPLTTKSMQSPTCACLMWMRKVPTDVRLRGSCCTSIRIANLIERGRPLRAISPAPNVRHAKDTGTCFKAAGLVECFATDRRISSTARKKAHDYIEKTNQSPSAVEMTLRVANAISNF